MSKPVQRFGTGQSVTSSDESETLADILKAYDSPRGDEMDDRAYYDQAEPDLMGDPFEQAKWFEENDFMD